MWELDYKESWVLKNWCFWSVVLEKTLENPLDCKEIQLVNPKGNQSWISIGRTDAEAPVLWLPDGKNWLTGKDPDAGKDWRQEKGMTEDGMVGWHHWLNGHEFEHAPGVGYGQGILACCSPWGCKESDMTERLNWTSSKEQASFNFLAGVTICSDFGAQENKLSLFPLFPYLFTSKVMGPDAMIFVFWMLSFNPSFSLSSFTFIKRLFSSSLSAIGWYHLHIWGYWYFSQPYWFQLVLHPAQHFSWCILHIS